MPFLFVLASGLAVAQSVAQPATPEKKKPVKPAPAAAAPAATPAAPPRAAPAEARAAAPAPLSRAPLPGPSGVGYRTDHLPAWVQAVPATPAAPSAPADSGARARRELLFDLQMQLAQPKPQTFFRWRSVALDSSTLRDVSQPQVNFNPAYQTVLLHEAAVIRGGQRLDRLADARVELLRREQQLERQVIDGVQTALLVLNDVRVGDAVEVAYSVEGENPIFEGRVSTLLQLAWDSPIDVLHVRIEAPLGRTLHTRGIGGDVAVERLVQGERQVLRVLRTQVAPIPQEAAPPPWFKVYPALHVSDFADWAEVNRWAQRLFAPAPEASAELKALAATLKQRSLAPEQLVAEALRFVQDEVRYFSVSLGESSHRPKAPAQTLAERLGDCKDKVMLLNALLGELGVAAKPALVSTARNRGVVAYLPAHDPFDHVISRVELGDKVYFLDPTMNGQGLSLASRGYLSYGKALVVGGADELVDVVPPAFAQERLEHEQRWNLTDPRKDARLTVLMRAHGLAAERWRQVVAGAGTQRIGDALAGAYARVAPNLKLVGELAVQDDRERNLLELRLEFTQAKPGQYSRGGIDLEFSAIELLDVLTGPPEARRRAPFLIDQPRVVDYRIIVDAPRPLTFRPPPPQQVADPHFGLDWRVEVAGNTGTVHLHYERRSDDVQPANLETFRERIGRARALTGNRLRLAVVDFAALRPEFERVDRKLRGARGFKQDQLHEILLRNEVNRVLDTAALVGFGLEGGHAARAFAERATTNNLLGDFESSMADSQAALATEPNNADALEARAVALVGLGRDRDALALLESPALANRNATRNWLGTTHYYLGDYARAEQVLRETVQTGGDEEREFAKLWLYLTAERQGGRGREAIAAHAASADASKLTGALLHYFDDRLDRDGLLKVARARQEMERLNLAEAYFFIGERLQAQGKRPDALTWFERVVGTGAVPYREYTYAKRELAAGARR